MITPHLLPDVGSDPRRLVALDAVHNFRDLGGYPTTDGHVTRWGRLFRADGLYRLAGDDLDRVRRLGLRTVVDLRTDSELAERGMFPISEHPVDFHHVSVLERTWDANDVTDDTDPAEYLEWAYLVMLDEGEAHFARAIEALGAADALPAVFHCAAGKDRTGMLAMLVLGLLEVADEYIVADYALTEAGMQRMRDWSTREFPDMYARMRTMPAAFSAAVPEAMLRVLGNVRRRWGSVGNLVREIGVTAETVHRLRVELLD